MKRYKVKTSTGTEKKMKTETGKALDKILETARRGEVNRMELVETVENLIETINAMESIIANQRWLMFFLSSLFVICVLAIICFR